VLRGVEVSATSRDRRAGKEILDARRHVGCNDLGTATLLAAMTRLDIRRMSAGSVVIYGSSRYTCPEHGRVKPAADRDDLAAGRFAPVCGTCGAELAASASTRKRPEPAAQRVRRHQARPGVARRRLAVQTGGCAVSLRYQRLRARDAYASPYSGVTATFRSGSPRPTATVYEDGAPGGTSSRADIGSANVCASVGAEAACARSTWPVGIHVHSGRCQRGRQRAADRSRSSPAIPGRRRARHPRLAAAVIRELGWCPASTSTPA